MPPIHEILVKKNLNPQLFETPVRLTTDMPLDAHVAWVYENIYSKPYPKKRTSSGIARQIHGIQHVTRAAINIPIFANLFRRYGDAEALALDDNDIKLLQIAALFHDAAREGEGVDLWDQESALLFYHYATKIMGVPEEKATLLAEAIANKDAEENNYFELSGMEWVKRARPSPKNIYQTLIHEADCLEIIRARDHFDANYLDFYKRIASQNEDAFEMMAKLITEARSLIAFQGDSRFKLDHALKRRYENQHAYRDIMAFIAENASRYPLITALSGNQVLSGDTLHQPLLRRFSTEISPGVTEESLTQAMHAGKLFARGVAAPAGFYRARKKDDEYAAQLEIRKILRRPGVQTRTLKSNRREKYGNFNRSVLLVSPGAIPLFNTGFFIKDPIMEHVAAVFSVNINSGNGKKSHLKLPNRTKEENETSLRALHRQLKMGGLSVAGPPGFPALANTEIIYRVTEVHAIYFTQDPITYDARNSPKPYLNALFLQKEYLRATGVTLPIYMYSGVHNFIKTVPTYTDNDIVAMWVPLVSACIKNKLMVNGYCSESLEVLKIDAIHGKKNRNSLVKKQVTLDLHYSAELRAKIDLSLTAERLKCLLEHESQTKQRFQGAYDACFQLYKRIPLDTEPDKNKKKQLEKVRIHLSQLLTEVKKLSKNATDATDLKALFKLSNLSKVLEATCERLQGRMNHSTYEACADTMQGHSNVAMQNLGGVMLLLGAVLLVAGIVWPPMMGSGVVCGLIGAGFFYQGRQLGMSRTACMINDAMQKAGNPSLVAAGA